MTGFVRNSWYCAAWSSELTTKPLGRQIVGEHVVLYRSQDGQAIALSGRCPHRFAPLAMGVVTGDRIACAYHGLQFSSDGRCVLNPHGGSIPPRAKLTKFTLLERHGVLWIWMGDPEKADKTLLPDDQWITDPGFSVRSLHLNVPANYQLIVDNLLDLTHAPYIHANSIAGDPESMGVLEHTSGADGQLVYSNYHTSSMARNRVMENLFPDKAGESVFNMVWRPASTLNFDVQMYRIGSGRTGGLYLPSAHYLTPETETTTHYFAAVGRNVNIHDEAEDERMISLVYQAFKHEDEPMLKACQDMMGTTDLFSLKPAILETDAPALLARRRLRELSAEETGIAHVDVS